MFHNRITDCPLPDGSDGKSPAQTSTATAAINCPAITPDLYAVAWSMAQRDYELDRLFNAAFYYEI